MKADLASGSGVLHTGLFPESLKGKMNVSHWHQRACTSASDTKRYLTHLEKYRYVTSWEENGLFFFPPPRTPFHSHAALVFFADIVQNLMRPSSGAASRTCSSAHRRFLQASWSADDWLSWSVHHCSCLVSECFCLQVLCQGAASLTGISDWLEF